MDQGSGIMKKSLKPQAPATICHIDTIYSGATKYQKYHLTFILISYTIYDRKGEN